MRLKTVRMSEKGQIVLPADIRRGAGIETGDQLLVLEDRGKILLEKSTAAAGAIKDDFRDILALSEQSLKGVWLNEADDVWNTYLKKKGR